jgi:hypothetical protein
MKGYGAKCKYRYKIFLMRFIPLCNFISIILCITMKHKNIVFLINVICFETFYGPSHVFVYVTKRRYI